ncbi:TrmB family transcriptional regulator [Geomicrobium sp. JSM 1781026]|uniref:TrmB family transcriptional regulator n=1 Tax=Geomicrobium sp. JSM 1781026 TaxID=3344580 RepID=UPI0035BFF89A
MDNDEVIEVLKQYGFTMYEAKVYSSLVYKSPANGNMIATHSSVPSPKVYEALRNLSKKGFVFLVSSGDKSTNKLYTPLPYKDLIQRIEERTYEQIRFLGESLQTISDQHEKTWPDLFHVEGYETSMDAIVTKINEAKHSILLSGWSKEIITLQPFLLAAHKRGIQIVSLHFDMNPTLNTIPWRCFDHLYTETVMKRHKNELTLVIDNQTSINFEANPHHANTVMTNHQFMVQTSVNYIRHDIYVNRVLRDVGEHKLKKLYGETLEGLIDDF